MCQGTCDSPVYAFLESRDSLGVCIAGELWFPMAYASPGSRMFIKFENLCKNVEKIKISKM